MSRAVNDAIVGIQRAYERVCEFQERFGAEASAPAPLLVQLATE